MEIRIPPNLTNDELKCFNEIVKPQLEELYSYNYSNFKFENIKVFISKHKFPDNIKRPDIKEIKNVLNKIPEKHLKIISDVYFVSYNCKDETENYLINGRTLPLIHKIIIYPKAYSRLKIILTHEIGHLMFEKGLSNKLKLLFASELIKTFPQIILWTQEEKGKFIREEFANCYENFINSPKRLIKFPLLHNFFKKYF